MNNRVILKIKAGSHLYGLNTETSDEDYIGVYLSTPDEIYGLQKSEIVDESVVSKQDNGRNASDAVDCKYYELRKFCTLALTANPTILELLFARKENIIICDEYGQMLIDNRDKFLSTRVKHTYLGYAHSQVAKSQVKSENLRILFKARDILKECCQNAMLYNLTYYEEGEQLVVDKYEDIIKIDGSFPNYVIIADLKLNNQKIKDVVAKIEFRINNATNRADGMLQHGLDYKFICHTYRLIKEGEELLKTGNLKFPLKDRDLLMEIKLGKIKPTEVMDLIGDLEETKAEWEKYDLLPRSSDFKGVNKMVIDMYKKYVTKEVMMDRLKNMCENDCEDDD